MAPKVTTKASRSTNKREPYERTSRITPAPIRKRRLYYRDLANLTFPFSRCKKHNSTAGAAVQSIETYEKSSSSETDEAPKKAKKRKKSRHQPHGVVPVDTSTQKSSPPRHHAPKRESTLSLSPSQAQRPDRERSHRLQIIAPHVKSESPDQSENEVSEPETRVTKKRRSNKKWKRRRDIEPESEASSQHENPSKERSCKKSNRHRENQRESGPSNQHDSPSKEEFRLLKEELQSLKQLLTQQFTQSMSISTSSSVNSKTNDRGPSFQRNPRTRNRRRDPPRQALSSPDPVPRNPNLIPLPDTSTRFIRIPNSIQLVRPHSPRQVQDAGPYLVSHEDHIYPDYYRPVNRTVQRLQDTRSKDTQGLSYDRGKREQRATPADHEL